MRIALGHKWNVEFLYISLHLHTSHQESTLRYSRKGFAVASRLSRGFRLEYRPEGHGGGRTVVWQKPRNICTRAKMTWVRSATSARRTSGFSRRWLAYAGCQGKAISLDIHFASFKSRIKYRNSRYIARLFSVLFLDQKSASFSIFVALHLLLVIGFF